MISSRRKVAAADHAVRDSHRERHANRSLIPTSPASRLRCTPTGHCLHPTCPSTHRRIRSRRCAACRSQHRLEHRVSLEHAGVLRVTATLCGCRSASVLLGKGHLDVLQTPLQEPYVVNARRPRLCCAGVVSSGAGWQRFHGGSCDQSPSAVRCIAFVSRDAAVICAHSMTDARENA